MANVRLNFNDLAAGTIVDGQYTSQGVTISSGDPDHPVMIFDTSNPTGGDYDLATHNLGNVLILSEDGDQSDPDDNACGGSLLFEFESPASVNYLTFLDIEEGAYVKFYAPDGSYMGTACIPATCNGGQLNVCFNVDNVGSMEVILPGSGAIDNLGYSINSDPDAVDDVAEVDEDASVIIPVLDNDSDPEGDTLTITNAVSADGQVVINDDGTITFIPDANFNGTASIDYEISDGNGGTDTATVTVTVVPVNDAPDAVDDHDTTEEDTSIIVDLLANDTDIDGDDLTVTYVSVPAEQGTVVNNGDGTATFTPAPDFNGTAMISYDIADGNGGRDWAKHFVEVTPVNDAPDAVDDHDMTEEDTSIIVDLLANDTDVDGDPLTVTYVSVPAEQGTVVNNGDGTATFTPALDFTGTAMISYDIKDGNGGRDWAKHFVEVTSVNDGPVAVDDDDSTDQDTVIDLENILGNDSDPDGDDLTVVKVSDDAASVGTPVAGDNGGLITINADGSASFDPNGEFDYLAEGETAQTVVSYTISDGNGGTDVAEVTILVEGLNDGPDAVDDEAETDEDTPVTIAVLENDGDPEGDPLEVISANSPNGDVVINDDGTVTFRPDPGFNGTTTIEYVISDGNGGTDTATVTVTVNAVNDGPVATDNLYFVTADEAFADVDGNIITDDTGDGVDSDDDGDTLTVTSVAGLAANVGAAVAGDNGGLFIINEDGTVDFDANGDFDDLGLNQTAQTSVTYTISDGKGGFDTATATFVVAGLNNGIVEGTDGDDVLGPGTDVIPPYVDADGDAIDSGDAILPGEVGDDDIIYGFGGNDTIDAGDGDDEVYGGVGDDTITGGDGNDTVYGGAGDDVIDTSNPNDDALPDIGYPGLYPADTDPNDDKDTVFGGAGNDTIFTGDDDDVIFGGAGNDTIDAGWDDDEVRGGAGDDTIIGNEGNDTIYGNAGDDVIYGGLGPYAPDVINIPDDGSGPFGPDLVPENNGDTIFGGDGNDIIFGQDDDDTLFGGAGNDILDGGVDDDVISGGDGEDQIIGGQGADAMSGGQGSDLFLGATAGDVVIGGEDADDSDIDVLDLRGTGAHKIIYNDDDPEAGIVTFVDGSTMEFEEIENVIPCFTPGTRIATARGERLVEELTAGDKIITRDNGIQEIAWVGHKTLHARDLIMGEHLRPVMIRAGALGNGLPERDMMVSPNHRMLVASDMTQLYFEEREVLAAAKHMVGIDGVQRADVTKATYIHFMFERHEVVLAEGAWTESFQPGDYSLNGIGNSQRNEILELFPELSNEKGLGGYQAARRTLKKHEARLLVH